MHKNSIEVGFNLGNALQRLAERNQSRIFSYHAIRHKIAQDKKAGVRPTPSKYKPHYGKKETAKFVARRAAR